MAAVMVMGISVLALLKLDWRPPIHLLSAKSVHDVGAGTGGRRARQTRGVDLHTYRFRSTWRLVAAPNDVYQALRDVDDYPEWWPQVHRADRVDDATYDMVVRSLLPYDLSFRSIRSREDPSARILEATMSGDLDGFTRWTVTMDDSGSRLVFEEEVVARNALLRRLAVVARPAFVANHAAMMRAGRRGLRAYLAGRRRGT